MIVLSFVLFQFHKGTIRTKWKNPSLWRIYGYFNSIKVRLELLAQSQSAQQYSFQFHKGTIRTYREGRNEG